MNPEVLADRQPLWRVFLLKPTGECCYADKAVRPRRNSLPTELESDDNQQRPRLVPLSFIFFLVAWDSLCRIIALCDRHCRPQVLATEGRKKPYDVLGGTAL
jgi:hypothetical protein